MSDEIVFDVLCTKVLDALRALGLGKFSISLQRIMVAKAECPPMPLISL